LSRANLLFKDEDAEGGSYQRRDVIPER
jgi:hypothetical protein